MKKIIIGLLLIAAVGFVACDSKSKKFPFGIFGDATDTASSTGTGSETGTDTGSSTGGGSDSGTDTGSATGSGTDTGSSTGTDTGSQAGNTGTTGNVPPDQNNDQTDTKEFKYQTVHDLSFELQLYDELNNPLAKAVVRVNTVDGDITTSVSAENGTLAFKTTLGNAIEKLSLIIEHANCVTKTVEIEGVQSLSQINRTIFLELKADKKPKPDRDKDGVPDDADEFPDDPTLIGSTNGEYTIAYEDNWPKKGDADFNDMVVRLKLREYIDNNNMISKIDVTAKCLAAGAGYKNELWIGVLGKEYALITNTAKDLNGKWNSKKKETYVEAPEHKVQIVLDAPVARDKMDAMPYDPYLRSNGNDKNQVHLSFVKTKFTGVVLDSDNFPWAVLVPADWSWPYEGTNISTAYPEFEKWYKSQGAEYKDWYLHPVSDYIFKLPAGTALAAYLMKVSSHFNNAVMVTIISAVLLVILGVNFRRRRSQRVRAE